MSANKTQTICMAKTNHVCFLVFEWTNPFISHVSLSISNLHILKVMNTWLRYEAVNECNESLLQFWLFLRMIQMWGTALDTHTHGRSVVKSLSCVGSMWIDPSVDGWLVSPGVEEQQLTPPTQATATPNTYVIQQVLYKSSAAPIETDTHRKRERILQILYIIKGIWPGRCVVRAAEKTQLYADDRWLFFLHLWQSMVSICCDGDTYTVSKGLGWDLLDGWLVGWLVGWLICSCWPISH